MKRWVWVVSVLLVLIATGAGYAALQLVTLQPPVTEIGFLERKKARRYQETSNPLPLREYRAIQAGEAVLFKAGSRGQVIVALPDSGTGPWVFDKYLETLGKQHTVYAVGLRGMTGARSASNANVDDYLLDARQALAVARQDAGGRKVVLLGQGLGSLLALKLALEAPQLLESLILLAPYPPRPWTSEQGFLARTVGGWAYSRVFASPQTLKTFWQENFPSWFVQQDVARQYLEAHVSTKVPYEYRAVVNEVTLGPLRWLDDAYPALKATDLPVLHIAAKFDVTNPLGAQLELRKRLEGTLHDQYSFALLLSGRLVPLDWKWRDSVRVIERFLRDRTLGKAVIQNEEVLDPVLDPPER